MESGFVEASGSAEGGQFAVAVSGSGIRREAERFQQPQSTEADRADGRLGRIGGAQRLFLPLCGASAEKAVAG